MQCCPNAYLIFYVIAAFLAGCAAYFVKSMGWFNVNLPTHEVGELIVMEGYNLFLATARIYRSAVWQLLPGLAADREIFWRARARLFGFGAVDAVSAGIFINTRWSITASPKTAENFSGKWPTTSLFAMNSYFFSPSSAYHAKFLHHKRLLMRKNHHLKPVTTSSGKT